VKALEVLLASVMLSPGTPAVTAVAVTVVLFELAVTPAAAGHRAIADARFEAKVVVVLLVANVPAVELPQLFEPLVPAVTVPHE